MRLHHHRRPAHPVPRPQRLAPHEARLDPRAAEKDRRHQRHLQRRLRALRLGQQRLAQVRRPAHRLGLHRLDDERGVAGIEAEPRPVRRLERFAQRGQSRERDRQRRVGPLHLQVQHLAQRNLPRRHALLLDLALGVRAQRVQQRRRRQPALPVQLRLHRLHPRGADVGQPHPVGREQRRHRVDQAGPHPQRVGDGAGSLRPRAAEHRQAVPRDVIAPLHADRLDRVRHVLDRNPQEPLRHLLRRPADLRRQRREALPRRRHVERPVPPGPEDRRKELRPQPPGQHVGVGHRQRPAPPVGRRPRIRAGALRPHPHPRPVEAQDRPAARRHRMDHHHRRGDPHPGDRRVQHPLERTREMADVRRCPAHVEADDPPLPGDLAGPDRAHHAPRRPAQDRVLALEVPRPGQPARGLHEHELARHVPLERRRHPVDVAPQDRREIGVDHRGVAPAHHLHQRAHPVADRDLREPRRLRQRRRPRLVRPVAVAVHEDDGAGRQPRGARLGQVPRQPRLVERPLHRPVRPHPLLGLDHPGIEHLRQHDVPVEQPRPVLVGEPELLPQPARRHQHHRLPLALQQRIGGDRRAHLHAGDPPGRDGLLGPEPEKPPDPVQRRVGVLPRILRQELLPVQPPLRIARHDVGEGPAPVDPEIPPAHARPPAFRSSYGLETWRAVVFPQQAEKPAKKPCAHLRAQSGRNCGPRRHAAPRTDPA